MDVKSEKCQFIRQPKDFLRYYFHFLVDQIISINRNAYFLEKEFLEEDDVRRRIKLKKKSKESQIKQDKLGKSSK